MNIQDIGKNKGTLPELSNMFCLMVDHKEKGLSPCWYDADTDYFLRHVSGKEAVRTDWEICSEVKEIRPEEAGELWRDEHGGVAVTIIPFEEDRLHFQYVEGDEKASLFDPKGWHGEIIHGKNGWKRLYPPVEDESVERIEMIHSGYGTGGGICFKLRDNEPMVGDMIKARIEQSQAVIIEIPKETP